MIHIQRAMNHALYGINTSHARTRIMRTHKKARTPLGSTGFCDAAPDA
ncbi:MAG: hypothetical protein RIQ52_1654, partial [Pseudomonadota bacterium]